MLRLGVGDVRTESALKTRPCMLQRCLLERVSILKAPAYPPIPDLHIQLALNGLHKAYQMGRHSNSGLFSSFTDRRDLACA